MKLVFIAGKFAAANAWEVACNVHAAEAAALRVAQLGGMPVCPHSLGRSMFGTLPEKFWRRGCLELLGRCDGILLLSNWQKSTGAIEERSFAQANAVRIWGTGHLNTPDFVRWLVYPPERGASIKAAIEAGKAASK